MLEYVQLPHSLTLEQRNPAYLHTSESNRTISIILYSDVVEYFVLLNRFFPTVYSQAYIYNTVLLITPSVLKSVKILTFYF